MDKSPDVVGHHRPKYILTFDLAEKVQLFRSIGLEVPPINDPFFSKTREQTLQLFERIFPGIEICGINMSDLATKILAAAMLHQTPILHNTIIVSTCPEITALQPGAAYALHLNRLIDGDGKIIGIGPRPGTAPIDTQISELARYAQGHQVILVEDGSFSGTTLAYIIDKLQKKGLRVSAVVIGFAFQKAKDVLSQSFNVEVIAVEHVDGLVDWMPDHDFYPMVPNNGRVIGLRWLDEALPVYNENGMTFSVPYLEYFCPISDWASIPEKDKWLVSRFFARKTYDLFVLIHRLSNRQDITIGELTAILPRVSAPIRIKGGRLISANTKILEYLHDLLKEDWYVWSIKLRRQRHFFSYPPTG